MAASSEQQNDEEGKIQINSLVETFYFKLGNVF